MIQQVSDRREYFTTTFAREAASFQVISTLVQRQRGCLHERSAALGADERVTLRVNILVLPETAKQRIRTVTLSTLEAFHTVYHNDAVSGRFCNYLGVLNFVRFLLRCMSPLVSLTIGQTNEPFITVDALNSQSFLVLPQVLAKYPYSADFLVVTLFTVIRKPVFVRRHVRVQIVPVLPHKIVTNVAFQRTSHHFRIVRLLFDVTLLVNLQIMFLGELLIAKPTHEPPIPVHIRIVLFAVHPPHVTALSLRRWESSSAIETFILPGFIVLLKVQV